MRWLALVVLSSCDSVLGLHGTSPTDAAPAPFFDGPESFVCPAIGVTPSYSTDLHQVIVQYYEQYTISSGHDLALATNYSQLLVGPVDSILAPASGLETPAGYGFIRAALSPDGDAFVSYVNGGTFEYRTYVEQPDQTWARGPDAVAVTSSFYVVGAPSRGPQRHLIYLDSPTGTLHEQVEVSPGVWSVIGSIAPSALGLRTPAWVQLSADGLRLSLIASTLADMTFTPHAYYTDRPTIDGTFRVAELLSGIPGETLSDFYMTDDCSRVYISGLGRVLYLQQL